MAKTDKPESYKIFLLDAFGAFISILFLLVLYFFEEFFGMPTKVIVIFISFAILFFIYSTTIYFIKPADWKFYLKIIAILNYAYCLFTLYQILKNIDTITLYGYIYFVAEIIVIIALSTFETKKSRKNRRGSDLRTVGIEKSSNKNNFNYDR